MGTRPPCASSTPTAYSAPAPPLTTMMGGGGERGASKESMGEPYGVGRPPVVHHWPPIRSHIPPTVRILRSRHAVASILGLATLATPRFARVLPWWRARSRGVAAPGRVGVCVCAADGRIVSATGHRRGGAWAAGAIGGRGGRKRRAPQALQVTLGVVCSPWDRGAGPK